MTKTLVELLKEPTFQARCFLPNQEVLTPKNTQTVIEEWLKQELIQTDEGEYWRETHNEIIQDLIEKIYHSSPFSTKESEHGTK